MAALYFHIPFCKRVCGYCDFYRTTKLRLIDAVVEQMHRELEQESDFLHDRKVATIYFGGGTPSLLPPAEIERFIDHVRQLYDVVSDAEITIEVNPDDITDEYVAALQKSSVNRISMGVQSLDDDCLRLMGRRHTAEQAIEAVERLKRGGYHNISLDLIFGIDGFGGDSLQRSVEGIAALDVAHISAYHLTIEEGSRFGRLVASGAMKQIADDRSEEEFLLVHRLLTANGYEHYEVSNYAKPNMRSRHNSSYWLDIEYLGIGAGAHSYNGDVRRWCEQPIEEYISKITYDIEPQDNTVRLNECIMVGLRRAEGISLRDIAHRFGDDAARRIEKLSSSFIEQGVLVERVSDDDHRIAIPAEKFLVSDLVISTLFVI
ncbi:MAG: radical SAM family heme chaperone HemW [Alistipes sp.]|nr:radical SAM family heme chaperone HemW [Alistipes sp.]